jgi:hypothetical protein
MEIKNDRIITNQSTYFATDKWIYSNETSAKQRFYFAANARTYYQGYPSANISHEFRGSGGTGILEVRDDGVVLLSSGSGATPKVGIGTTSPTARLQVKGAGATAATNAVTVQNSSGTQILNIRDDGFTTIGQSNQGLTTYGVIGTGIVETGSTGQFTSTSRFAIKPDASTGADGNILLSNTAGSSFGILKLGGTTSSFPAIKRNLAVIDFKLADDSGYCDTQSGNLNYQFLVHF